MEKKRRGKGSKELNKREKDILKFIEKQIDEIKKQIFIGKLINFGVYFNYNT